MGKEAVREAMNYLKVNPKSSLDVVEFCVYDDLTMGYFRKEFEKIA